MFTSETDEERAASSTRRGVIAQNPSYANEQEQSEPSAPGAQDRQQDPTGQNDEPRAVSRIVERATEFVASAVEVVRDVVDQVRSGYAEVAESYEQRTREREFDDAVQGAQSAYDPAELSKRKKAFAQAMNFRENSSDSSFDYILNDQKRLLELTADPDVRLPGMALNTEMLEAAALSNDWDVSLKKGVLVFENDDGRFFDAGSRIVGQSGNDAEIAGVLALAEKKGWSELEFQGSDDFKARAMYAARDQGFGVFAQGDDAQFLSRVDAAIEERNRLQDRANDLSDDYGVGLRQAQADVARRQETIAEQTVLDNGLTKAESDRFEEIAAREEIRSSGDDPAREVTEIVGTTAQLGDDGAIDALDELPIFKPRPIDIVSDRDTKAFAANQLITVVARTPEGDVIGRDGGAYAKVSRSAFEEPPKPGETLLVSRGADGRDVARPVSREQEQSHALEV